ncbi:hypothetical protein B0H13DRAFT_2324507 [Mycena leptocephala]|nr:hypothetical protein B0H13DRAFT_2324507 [Mycena leptocephala]
MELVRFRPTLAHSHVLPFDISCARFPSIFARPSALCEHFPSMTCTHPAAASPPHRALPSTKHAMARDGESAISQHFVYLPSARLSQAASFTARSSRGRRGNVRQKVASPPSLFSLPARPSLIGLAIALRTTLANPQPSSLLNHLHTQPTFSMRDVSVDARFAPPTKTSNSAGVLPMLHLPPFASTGTSPLMRVLVRNGLALVRMSSIPHFIPFPVHDPYHAPHYPSNELLEIEGSTAVQHSLPCRIPRLLVILLNFPQCASFLSIFCTLGCVWTIVEPADCGAYGHAAQFLLFHRGAALTFYVCVQYSTNHARLYIHPAKGYTHPEFSARMGTYFIVLNQDRKPKPRQQGFGWAGAAGVACGVA